jgi:RNA polymerase-binding transcription factor DksA
MPNPNHLTKVQRGIIGNVLQTRYAEVERQAALHMNGETQVERANERMQTEPHEGNQNDGDLEVEGSLSDMQSETFKALTAAMDRIHGPDYGICVDCKQPIAFARLRAQPDALRCLACETIFEARRL